MGPEGNTPREGPVRMPGGKDRVEGRKCCSADVIKPQGRAFEESWYVAWSFLAGEVPRRVGAEEVLAVRGM
jgi:hypothetical protein